jgi:hypothetical protein
VRDRCIIHEVFGWVVLRDLKLSVLDDAVKENGMLHQHQHRPGLDLVQYTSKAS